MIGTVVTAVAELLARTIVVLFVIVFTFAVKSAPPAPAPETVTKSPTFKSVTNEVPNPVTFAFEPFMVTEPLRVVDWSNTASAVKSAVVFGESIKKAFTSVKFLKVIPFIVKSVLLEFSIIWSATFELVDISFSPTTKLPTTFITSRFVDEELFRNAVAPDVAPVIFAPLTAPPALLLAGVPDKDNFVNILISKRYKLN